MFVDITSKENKYEEDKKNNNIETEPICIKSVVQLTTHYTNMQLMMTTTSVHHEAICQSETVPTGHIVDFTTHTSTICIRYQLLLAAYYEVTIAFILSSCFIYV
jgi:hypothetical protein